MTPMEWARKKALYLLHSWVNCPEHLKEPFWKLAAATLAVAAEGMNCPDQADDEIDVNLVRTAVQTCLLSKWFLRS